MVTLINWTKLINLTLQCTFYSTLLKNKNPTEHLYFCNSTDNLNSYACSIQIWQIIICMADFTKKKSHAFFLGRNAHSANRTVSFIDSVPGRSPMELCAAVMVQSIRSLLQWNALPLPPFRDYSNWLLPLPYNPIERMRRLYLTVWDSLVCALWASAACHICRVAHETDEVLNSPPFVTGPHAVALGWSFLGCTCHPGEIVCMKSPNRKQNTAFLITSNGTADKRFSVISSHLNQNV